MELEGRWSQDAKLERCTQPTTNSRQNSKFRSLSCHRALKPKLEAEPRVNTGSKGWRLDSGIIRLTTELANPEERQSNGVLAECWVAGPRIQVQVRGCNSETGTDPSQNTTVNPMSPVYRLLIVFVRCLVTFSALLFVHLNAMKIETSLTESQPLPQFYLCLKCLPDRHQLRPSNSLYMAQACTPAILFLLESPSRCLAPILFDTDSVNSLPRWAFQPRS